MKRLRKEHFFAIWDAFDKWLWNLCSKHGCHAFVLMYHELTYNNEIKETSCLHHVLTFQNTINRMQEEGYIFVSLDKIVQKPTKGEKIVAITFDDVHSSVYKYAYSFLSKKQIPFTLFVAPGFVGKENMISLDDLKKMAADNLCIVGAHTMTHPMLRKVNNSKEEIFQSKKWLEEILGKKVEYFAYPYGKHSSVSFRNMCQAKKAGFKAAFGTIDAPITLLTQYFSYYLPRMVFHK